MLVSSARDWADQACRTKTETANPGSFGMPGTFGTERVCYVRSSGGGQVRSRCHKVWHRILLLVCCCAKRSLAFGSQMVGIPPVCNCSSSLGGFHMYRLLPRVVVLARRRVKTCAVVPENFCLCFVTN